RAGRPSDLHARRRRLRRGEPGGRCRRHPHQPETEERSMSTDANSLGDLKAGATDAAEVPKESLTTYVPFYKRVLAQPQGKIGLIITVIVVVLALCGPLLLPWATGNTATEFVVKPFSPYGLFGSDNLGRDVLSRFIAGGLTLIVSAVLATVLGMVVGALVGMLAAYIGGRFDAIIMRLNDVILAIPQLVFALLAITVLGPQGWVLVTVIGLTHAPRIARVARSATLGVITEDYIKAAEMYVVPRWAVLGTGIGLTRAPRIARVARSATLGVITEDYIKAAEMYAMPRWKMLLRELLPNITGPLSVEAGLRLTYSIGYIASLSFLGLGLQPPAADWGLMINENRIALSIQPWGVLLPVIAIALLTIGTNLLADSFARATASTSVEA